jgi:hypothetical protein
MTTSMPEATLVLLIGAATRSHARSSGITERRRWGCATLLGMGPVYEWAPTSALRKKTLRWRVFSPCASRCLGVIGTGGRPIMLRGEWVAVSGVRGAVAVVVTVGRGRCAAEPGGRREAALATNAARPRGRPRGRELRSSSRRDVCADPVFETRSRARDVRLQPAGAWRLRSPMIRPASWLIGARSAPVRAARYRASDDAERVRPRVAGR